MNKAKEFIELVEEDAEATDIVVNGAKAMDIGPWADAHGNAGEGYYWVSDDGKDHGNFDMVTMRGHKNLDPDKIALYYVKKGHDRPPKELVDTIKGKLQNEQS